jgi:hypothetical protein
MKEIELVRSDLSKDIKDVEIKLAKEINKQTMITISSITSTLGLLIVLSKTGII